MGRYGLGLLGVLVAFASTWVRTVWRPVLEVGTVVGLLAILVPALVGQDTDGVPAPLALVPTLLDPPPVVVALLAATCGFAVAGLLPVANGLFVQALPHGYRARAFGVMATGIQVMQGVAVFATGLLADRYPLPAVVGLWSLAGVGAMLLCALRWPDAERFAAAIAAASEANGTSVATPPTQAAPPRSTAAPETAREGAS